MFIQFTSNLQLKGFVIISNGDIRKLIKINTRQQIDSQQNIVKVCQSKLKQVSVKKNIKGIKKNVL